MSGTIVKIINFRTGKEFTDLDPHIIAYAKGDPSTFELVYSQEEEEKEDELFTVDDLKAMNMKDLKATYDALAEKLGEAMPKARKNSPTEVLSAIVTAQELCATLGKKED